MRNHRKKLFIEIRNLFLKFFLIDDSPHRVAGGAALGVFWGIMPGEGVGTTIVTSTILRLNRLSAMVGVLATNTWLTFFVLPLSAIIGSLLFKTNSGVLIQDFKDTYQLGLRYFFTEDIFSHLLLPLIVGFIISSLAISLIVYCSLFFLLKYKRARFR